MSHNSCVMVQKLIIFSVHKNCHQQKNTGYAQHRRIESVQRKEKTILNHKYIVKFKKICFWKSMQMTWRINSWTYLNLVCSTAFLQTSPVIQLSFSMSMQNSSSGYSPDWNKCVSCMCKKTSELFGHFFSLFLRHPKRNQNCGSKIILN